jgi:hypothetical protein
MSNIQCLQNEHLTANAQAPDKDKSPSKRISDALACIGGNRASELAELCGFPHEAIFNAPASILHFAAFRLSVSENALIEARAALQSKSWPTDSSKTLEHHCTQPVFQKLALPVWQKADYQRLASLLVHENARKALQHQATIHPMDVRVLAELPSFARTSRIWALVKCPCEAEFLRRLVEKIFVDKPDRKAPLTQRIIGARSRKRLWRAIYEEVYSIKPDYPELPVDLPPGYRQIRNVRDLARTARYFQNCIKSFETELRQGAIAFIVRTYEPEAVIEVAPRFNGLVFDDILGKQNEPLEKDKLAEIESHLKNAGLRKGQVGRLHLCEDQLASIVGSLMRTAAVNDNRRVCKRAQAGIDILKSDGAPQDEVELLFELEDFDTLAD